eukprot:GHVU01215031.1.p2 GENE.GHVU01215031.1~~GHVU01215031.1.p2  ORF type:complete len:193 (+),score=10.00 GHVU01215031.1:1152-1730(+)
MKREDFFQEGLPVDTLNFKLKIPFFLERFRSSPASSLRMIELDHELALEMLKEDNYLGRYLIFRFLFCIFQIKIWHHPQAHLKSVYKKVIDKNTVLAESIMSEKFRTEVRFNQYLARFYNLLTSGYKNRPKKINDGAESIFVGSVSELETHYADFEKCYFICLCERAGVSIATLQKMSQSFQYWLRCRLNED